ncbi:hypothetical protein EB796_020817 [Bugula neritina]|uniref:Lipase domain-containing protein n=1 Tax=Bugula neritina TaxID=10212 RepID=A0A7J7J402_BUGNE|nr:hypothetical protein EB796_020817 [Bugula neritina]
MHDYNLQANKEVPVIFRPSVMKYCATILLLAVVGTFFCISEAHYNVHEEVEELKKLLGDQVQDKPLDDKHESSTRNKRFLFSSDEPYCHDKLGCFPIDGDFSDRPVNFNPNSRETINTQFTLFTRRNPKNGQNLKADDISTLSGSYFNADRKTKFMIHGFLESAKASWFQPMNDELLKNGDFNVINVDWGGIRGSKTLYTQATANTRVVAAEIVYLIKSLVKTNSMALANVHLIGHSLGSHISGYVGKNLSSAIGRITGLDPAEPYFEGYSTAIRLDPSDAQFVDIIHSDADSITEVISGEGGFGSKELSGHADFFPNGGEDQPNCKNGILTNVKLENDFESVNDCDFNSILCSSFKDYEDGKCSIACDTTDNCNSMGFAAHKPANKGYKKYYLHTTGIDNNFCASGFRVDVTMDPGSLEFYGEIDITVSDSKGTKQTFKVNREKNVLKAGATHSYVVAFPKTMGHPTSMEIVWTRDLSWWRVITKACGFLRFCNNAVKIHEIALTTSDKNGYYFCGSGKSFTSGKPTSIYYSKTSC